MKQPTYHGEISHEGIEQAFRADWFTSINGNVAIRRAIGYVRVSTDMQANEGISLEAQQAAIQQYCSLHAG